MTDTHSVVSFSFCRCYFCDLLLEGKRQILGLFCASVGEYEAANYRPAISDIFFDDTKMNAYKYFIVDE